MRLRLVLAVSAAALLASACSKPASSDKPVADKAGATHKVMVPGGEGDGAPRMTMGSPEGAIGAARGGGGDTNTLKAEEGKLAVETPADPKAGAELTAKIVVTPTADYHINTEFPTKLTLEAPAGVTVAKAQLTAGGGDKAKGDASQFDERQLAFDVKLTPGATGNYTINGTFKFAVCKKDSCLPKKEAISIVVAAK